MRARAPVAASGLAAVVLAVAYLLAPPLGTDLSAQVARARFFAGYGLTPVDLGWYGGTVQYGYSLVSPAVMALLGVPLTGALALVVSALAFAGLLVRTRATRPLLGGVVGALCIAGNLVSGRVTYALGVAFGLLALLALTAPRRWVRFAGGAAGALLASATSPVAGLFVGLAAAALLLSRDHERSGGPRRPKSFMIIGRGVDAAAVGCAAAIPLGLTALLFGEGGWMNISRSDTVHAVLTSLAVAAVTPRRPVRVGAVLSALGVLTAYLVHTPVGLNATRLVTMFALPVVAAYVQLPASWQARIRPAALAGLLAVLALWQPPVLIGDARAAGTPSGYPSYFAPLRAELERRPPGRIEVPPTRDYWEAAYTTPLARGWLRQVDLDRNALFFDGKLTADRYRDWLVDNGVRYVALPDAEPSWVGRREAALVRGGLPYLTDLWRGDHWVLYEVAGQPSIVDGATLVTATGAAVTADVDGPGEALVRVRWSRWLDVRGPAGASLERAGRWSTLRVTVPGRYTISSQFVSTG